MLVKFKKIGYMLVTLVFCIIGSGVKNPAFLLGESVYANETSFRGAYRTDCGRSEL